jgi:hypothetical protein
MIVKDLTQDLAKDLISPLIGGDSDVNIITPDQIANYALDYYINAANVIKNGFNQVTQISDISGNNRHATQATLGNTFDFVDGVINSQAVVRSSGATKHYSFDGTFLQNKDFTILTVFKRAAGGQNIIMGNTNQNNCIRVEYANDTNWRTTTRSGFGSTAATSLPVPIPYQGGSEPFYVMASRFSAADGIKFYENNIEFGADPAHIVRNGANAGANIGRYLGIQTRWMTGDLARLLIYDGVVTTQELEGVTNYLNNIYNLY